MAEGRPVPCHACTSTPATCPYAGEDGPGQGLPLHQLKEVHFLIFQFCSQGLWQGRRCLVFNPTFLSSEAE